MLVLLPPGEIRWDDEFGLLAREWLLLANGLSIYDLLQIVHPLFFPYLVGLVPIFLARTWPARVVAILFGLVSIGLGGYYMQILNDDSDVLTGVQRVRFPIVGALSTALISLLVTYFVDKAYGKKS